MARKPLTKPRKKASQDRSRALVDTLIEATARILVKEGFDKASTNRIAAKAGVSVGSLYQYFPSKEALVAAVMAKHRQDLLGIARDTLKEAATLPLEPAVRKLVGVAIKAHSLDPKLHTVLAEQIPRTGGLENQASFNHETYALFRTYLEAHRTEIRTLDLELATFICVTTIEALTHTAVLHHAGRFSVRAYEALIDETTRLIVGYLR
jgi:AcrR family transcriptional regulator